MMERPHRPSRRLTELADRLLDQRLTDAEVVELEELLRAEKGAQAYLLDACQFHSLLTFDVRAQRVLDRVVAERSQRQRQGRGAQAAYPSAAASPAVRRTKATRTMRAATWGVAAALLLGLVATQFLDRLAPRVDVGPIVADSDDPRAHWPRITSVKIGPEVTELRLAEIGSVLLDGPTDFELIGPMRARLTHGKIRFRVSDERGRGFVVETPQGEVTDLGTEFGLSVSDDTTTRLLVFEGEVDLRVQNTPAAGHPQVRGDRRLVEGEGALVTATGHVDRIMTIFTREDATFTHLVNQWEATEPVIVGVEDSLRGADTMQFYEVVTAGMGEDARAYVDRPFHEWNGVDSRGMPAYLLGGDYIKPFNNDKMRRNFTLRVKLAVPADLYIFFDDRVPHPDWLVQDFTDTGDNIAIDMGTWRQQDGRIIKNTVGRGPGNDIDEVVSIWHRKITEPGTVKLGANAGLTYLTAMYGVCAVPIDQVPSETPTAIPLPTE